MRAQSHAEDKLLSEAPLYTFLLDFAKRDAFGLEYKTLHKIQLKSNPRLAQGYIASGILRAYHERCTSSGEQRALVAVYEYIAKIAPRILPKLPAGEKDFLQAFRSGKAPRAHDLAAQAYADALLALKDHVRLRNGDAQGTICATPKEVAEHIDMEPRAIRRWLADHHELALRRGPRVFVNLEALLGYEGARQFFNHEWLSPQDVADHIKVGQQRVWDLCEAERWGTKFAGQWRINVTELLQQYQELA
jgi:hypothetical protein